MCSGASPAHALLIGGQAALATCAVVTGPCFRGPFLLLLPDLCQRPAGPCEVPLPMSRIGNNSTERDPYRG